MREIDFDEVMAIHAYADSELQVSEKDDVIAYLFVDPQDKHGESLYSEGWIYRHHLRHLIEVLEMFDQGEGGE